MSWFSDLVNGTVSTATTLLSASLNWGTTANNGNLMGASYSNGGPTYSQPLTFSQTFTYDGVNRLTGAIDSGGWSRTLSYDAYGNMTPAGTPAPPTESFNGNNQIVGQSYDQIGNLLGVNGNTLAYDFDSHVQYETDGVSKAVETYFYDGDGHRVQKTGPNGSPVIHYVYDALGRMAAEYSSTTETPGCVTCYFSMDHLGSTRVVTDQNGLVVGRHDYLPFGEEVAASQFGRDGHWGGGTDFLNRKFTGKERDAESGLDYFGARYYGSGLGRFTSVDPDASTPTKMINPQRWNMYSYVTDNPLAYIDPTGEDAAAVNFSGSVGGFGHEGILSIHADGSVIYARFGPASLSLGGAFGLDEPGEIRSTSFGELPDVQFETNGAPTAASLAKVISTLKATGIEPQADPSNTRVNYFKTSEMDTFLLDDWIRTQAEASTRKGALWYHFCWNNCATFVRQGLIVGHAIAPQQAGHWNDVGPNALFFSLKDEVKTSITIKLHGATDCTNPKNPGCPL